MSAVCEPHRTPCCRASASAPSAVDAGRPDATPVDGSSPRRAWQVPRPTGPAHPGANRLGFARLGFTTADLDATHWLGRHALVLTLLGYAGGRLSATLVREIATLGGDVTKFVSPSVKRWLDEKLAKTPRE